MIDMMMARCVMACPLCGGESILNTEANKITEYRGGAHAQDVWPEKSIDWRETWISGSHGYCYDKVFSEQERKIEEEE